MSNFMYQAFSEVAKQKAFVTAAKVLNVTPSAISHSINGLEKELGFALFFRNRNGVQLTSAGEKILPIVRELLNTEDKLLEEAARINGLDQGRLRIGAFSSVCINWLPDMINTFKKNHPEIEVSVWQGNFNEVIQLWLVMWRINRLFSKRSIMIVILKKPWMIIMFLSIRSSTVSMMLRSLQWSNQDLALESYRN